MKLLNKEPTEEMIDAGLNVDLIPRYIWRAMFDAAPELTVDMEPFCRLYKWIDNSNFDMLTDSMPDDRDSEEILVYSATQLATIRGEAEVLQAENERLWKENGELKIALNKIEFGSFELATSYAKITAERDELRSGLTEISDKHPDPRSWPGVRAREILHKDWDELK